MRTLLLSAVEPSADALGAAVLRALQPRGWTAVGLGGPALRAAGLVPLAHMEDVVAMGLGDVLLRLPALLRARSRLRGALRDGGVHAFLGVDGSSFHGPLAAQARRVGVPAIALGAPQVWASRPGRVGVLVRRWSGILSFFPFEQAWWSAAAAQAGCAFAVVGHPAADGPGPRPPGTADPQLYALCPGSRPQERRRHLPVFLAAAAALRARQPQARVLVSDARPGEALPAWAHPVGPGMEPLRECRAALTKSGTITLELALAGLPMVVAHRVDPLTWAVGRRVVRGVRHLALPNILAGAEVVPERLQRLDPEELAGLLATAREAPPLPPGVPGPPGWAGRVADAVEAIVALRDASHAER